MVNEGGVVEFYFGDQWYNKMKVILRDDVSEEFKMHVVDGDDEWIDTDIEFKILDKSDKSYLVFKHMNWKSESENYAKCNHYWGNYLESLKSYCETGEGKPYKDR